MRFSRLLATLLFAAVLVTPVAVDAASSHITLKVTPKKALVGSKIQVNADHLSANAYYTLLMVGSNKKDKALLGLAKANGSGKILTVLRMPVIPHCGKTTVYLLDRKHTLAHATFTLTGCVLKPGSGGPPAPPPSR